MTNDQDFLIALGANLPSSAGAPEATLRAALAALTALGVTVSAISRFYRTPCFPPGAGPDYVNAAARLEGPSDPARMLALLHRVEADFHRVRAERWGRRTLDLDMIAAGAAVLPDAATQARWRCLPAEDQTRITPETLILPHPRLQDRAFVLVPLADIAPGWTHPLTGRTVGDMLADLPDESVDGVVPL
ncbi:2-amino-4-hydroxy-6-hydroxymethyldihydropteridine diphosphokinase [Roseovarius sp. TE539]|uniref:2-amino-4-hydroxy-6- hydroxymethyldihydropteridine diphosphokinase n=1 Tax=Roseovarius sp. TE539 TaxID=2249812 RepID=UPI000DDF4477|nr:2-amino-4-hydroxy-6-hydroxymethyldihydropteridine diphosphokinase [Roseovarius sp. TE539]RBI71893.1 2-amino-4-hydroxy-6-hydroxymethyldihydropteridine diphosphokinase [Roseovarius sp. TE539]